MSEQPPVVFGQNYAELYDAIYANKDYADEAKQIQNLLGTLNVPNNASLLDIGCGTGRHGCALADLGYQVRGVDLSPSMITAAQQRASQYAGPGSVQFEVGDARHFQLKEASPFDGCLFMFAVLGYLTSNDDVIAGLSRARANLKTGGALLFDLWYGPAVLTQRPGRSEKRFETSGGVFHRIGESSVDPLTHTCSMHYTLTREEDGANFEETHQMRFFFPQEIELFLRATGFDLVALSVPGQPNSTPNDESWEFQVSARAI